MVQINTKIKEIDQQLASEVQTIRDSLKAGYEASLARENELKERIQVLKQDVLDLQNRSIQYNILKREVDTNRELYASLLQRYKEVDVAGGVGANNVFVVDKAEVTRCSIFAKPLSCPCVGADAGLGGRLCRGLRSRVFGRQSSLCRAGGIDFGASSTGGDSKMLMTCMGELADPRSACGRSLPHALHGPAVRVGEWLAKDVVDHECHPIRGKVVHGDFDREAFRHAGPQGPVD